MQVGAIEICQIDSCRLGGVNEVLAVMLMAAKFEIPVCPHAGGVGLCEYVQHLSMIDYIAISGSKDGRIIEYVDHLHEHFYDPVVIKNGAYMPPQIPGYSITMKTDSLCDYQYPKGKIWQEIRSEKTKNTTMKNAYTLLLLLLLAGQSLFSQPDTYTPTAQNLEAREWFQDAKFGLFIHWGVYSILGDGEWVMEQQKSR